MSRRFPGYLREVRARVHPDLVVTSRPRINVVVSFGRGRLRVPFLIDTGADFTILQPDDARQLLRLSQQGSAEPGGSDALTISGIGSSMEPTTVHRVGLRFIDDHSEAYWFPQSILFADHPSSRRWNVPSVLGRDVLRRFDLNLSYDPPSVSLTLNQ
jgi:hypothetical protein